MENEKLDEESIEEKVRRFEEMCRESRRDELEEAEAAYDAHLREREMSIELELPFRVG
jgi:hypothetical protein